MNKILSMERDGYMRDYYLSLEAELREADERRGREMSRARRGRRPSLIRRALSRLSGPRTQG